MTATESFLKMYGRFQAWTPYDLRQENPAVLIALLSIGNLGVSQLELVTQLGIKQSHLSKLIKKLKRWELIAEEPDKTDGRIRLYRTSAGGLAFLSSLEQILTESAKDGAA